MNPELFTIPFVGLPVKSYGFMLMLGFLSGIWLGMRRAERVKANPDVILNCGILALFGGVGGARIFYVAHYWTTQFAYQKNPLWAAINITAGGLEYLGGLIGAVAAVALYVSLHGRIFARKEGCLSLRLYLDLLAPVAMWGLAFGRAGCYLNGCCWGGLCVAEHDHRTKALPWAVTFPFASGAHERQWMNRQVTVPAELIWEGAPGIHSPVLIPPDRLDLPPEAMRSAVELEELETQLREARDGGASREELKALNTKRTALKTSVKRLREQMAPLRGALKYASRKDPSRATTLSELQALAGRYRSLPVHPAQLYGLINALLLSWLLVLIFQRRRRHGVVMGWMLLLYPPARFVLELVRVDNPHDAGGLTISQAFGLGVMVVGLVWMYAMYKLPPRSPHAVPWIPPETDKPEPKADA